MDKYTERADGCWLWCGGSRIRGYGVLQVGRRAVLAHRLAWTIANGPIHEGLCVLHRCDRPQCVNPAHLFLGTPEDNRLDMIAKGRQARGETARSILTERDVREIVAAASGGEKLRAIADRFGVLHGTIVHILMGRTWAHVTGITPHPARPAGRPRKAVTA